MFRERNYKELNVKWHGFINIQNMTFHTPIQDIT